MTDTLTRLDGIPLSVAMVKKIADKVDVLFKPLEMAIARDKWDPEFRRIIWEACVIEAMKRRDAATRELAGIKDG
jgi:hypothetical protein